MFLPFASVPCTPSFNSRNSIIFLLFSLCSTISCTIFTLTFSSISFIYLFQLCIHYLYSSYPFCSLICFNKPCFSSSIIVNMVLNDLTSKPKLPIFRIIITIAQNILAILLPNTSSASSFTNFLMLNSLVSPPHMHLIMIFPCHLSVNLNSYPNLAFLVIMVYFVLTL